MRLFPRTARQRCATAALAASLALGALAVPLANADPSDHLKQKKQQAEKHVKHAQEALEHSSRRLQRAQAAVDRAVADLSAARGDYRSARGRLEQARERDREMQEKLEAAEQRLADAQIALAGGRVEVQEQKFLLTDTVTDIYEHGDPQLLAFSSLLRARSTTDLTRQQALNDVIVGRENRAYDDLQAAEVRLEIREAEVRTAHDDVETQRDEAAAHLLTMQQLTEETRTTKIRVQELVEKRRSLRAGAAQARKQDQRQLQQAKRQEQKIKQQILAASRRAKRTNSGYHGSTNGLFIRPVGGAVTSSFGYREHPIYHYWGLHNGTDFGVGCGEPMRAISGGTVLARYWSSVYGNRLFLNLGQINGHNVTAVYNHASSYRVGVGAKVAQGTTVGYVGSTGWSTGCHLHFTLLVDGNAVNPMNWLP